MKPRSGRSRRGEGDNCPRDISARPPRPGESRVSYEETVRRLRPGVSRCCADLTTTRLEPSARSATRSAKYSGNLAAENSVAWCQRKGHLIFEKDSRRRGAAQASSTLARTNDDYGGALEISFRLELER